MAGSSDKTLADFPRILVTRLRFLGDLVLATPVLRALRELAPRAEISFLAEEDYAEIFHGHPDIDCLLRLPRPPGWRPALSAWLACARLLRRKRYDLVLDLFANPRSAILTRITGAAVRVGGDHGARGRLFTHHPCYLAGDVTAVDHHLAHLRPLGIETPPRFSPRLVPSSEERSSAMRELREFLIDPLLPLVGLHPGATWIPKRWPLERFSMVADHLAREYGARFLITSGPAEQGVAGMLGSHLGDRVFQVRPGGWRRLAAFLSLCDLYLTNDCGPMHVAAACRTPTVAVFGPSDPRIWFPYPSDEGHRAVQADRPCRPCPGRECESPECMTAIPVEAVISAVDEAWNVGRSTVSRGSERATIAKDLGKDGP